MRKKLPAAGEGKEIFAPPAVRCYLCVRITCALVACGFGIML
jgi:hypothetical protein